jgi:dTDP-4-dehydrorhamnose 3,5-epimerase
MDLEPTPLKGVVLLKPKIFGDSRGFFLESWNRRVFAELGISEDFVQDNHSRSRQGILRGLHFQTEQPQGKLVRVTSGAVFDVAVDLRSDSPTCGQWVGYTLTEEGGEMLWVPPGFAHGFYVLSESADFLYKCTEYYHPQSELTLAWDDPQVGIDWPILDGQPPMLSEKDQSGLAYTEVPKFRV